MTRTRAYSPPWWWDRREVARLCEWLRIMEQYDAEQIIDVVGEPWHYEGERNRMIRDQAEAAA